MKKGTRSEASVHIDAAAQAVYDLITDVTRMGEWSPECVGAEWVDGATGPQVGARFRGRNRRGPGRWSTTPRVVVADRGREFAFVAPGLMGRDTTKWTYRFDPEGSGVSVVESFEMLRDQPAFYRVAQRLFLGVKDRQADLEQNMRHTLEVLKRVAESAH